MFSFGFTFSAAGSAKFWLFVVFSGRSSVKTCFSAYSHYPNPDKVAYLVQGLRDGFHQGIHYSTSLKLTAGNMALAPLNPQVVDNYLRSEVQMGRVAGPFSQPP